MKKWFGCCAVCLALWLPGVVQAQDAEQNGASVSSMEDVVVTASRVEEKKKDLTSNVIIIDEQEISMSPAVDLGDLLAEKGIGHIQKYPGLSTAVGMRGFRTDTTGNDLAGKVLILVDGRRAGTGDIAKIMTCNIERVEIIRGPASVQYGSAAMGGVINVITRQGKGQPEFFVDGGLGTFGHEKGAIGASGKVDRFDFSIGATREKMDDYDTASGDTYENTGYDKRDDVSLNLGFTFMPQNRISLIYNYFDADDVGSPGYFNQADPDAYTDIGLESIDMIYDGQSPGGLLSWKARYFSGKDQYKWVDPTWPSVYKKDTDHQGAQAQMTLSWHNSNITGGFDWVNYSIDSSATPEKSEYDNPAWFVLGKAILSDRLVMTGGLRYDDYKVDMKQDGGKENDDNLSCNIGAAYSITDYLKVRANYGEAFRMPTAEQLAGDYVAWISYLGNPDLKPEKSKTYECGFDLTCAAADFSATYFYTDFKDKIQVVTLPSVEQSYRNIGGATIAGIEGEVSIDLGAAFDWNYEVRPYGNVVYLTRYKDDETREDLLYTEDANVSWGLAFSDLKGLTANLNFAYTGEKRVEDWENWSDPVAVIKCGGFTVANCSISKKVCASDRFGGITLKGEALNIFDRDYAYISGYPMPGRSFFVSVKYAY